MQDSIALFGACVACGFDIPALLVEFERIRRPGSDALQQAAIKSTEWYEKVRSKLQLDPDMRMWTFPAARQRSRSHESA